MRVEASPRLTRRVESIRPSPTLAISRTLAEMRRQGRNVVDLGVGEPDFPTLEDLRPFATDRSRGIILNSPNNPTGAAIEMGELAKILAWARDRGLFVVYDECYEFFLYGGRPHASPTDLWEDHSGHVLIS